MHLHVHGAGGVMMTDGARVRQVLMNLLTNALKYSAAPSIVCVHVQGKAEALRVVVLDRGKGLTPEECARIFTEPQAIRTERSGLGLGLRLCAELIARLGGKIGVISRKTKGTLFWFTLPRHELRQSA